MISTCIHIQLKLSSTINSGNGERQGTFNFNCSMPSPSIPRSRSAPKISANPSSPSSSDVLPAPSIQSLRSENSQRTYWPKKLNDILARKGSFSSKNPKLTEESLKEFNRLNEILEEKRFLSYSPYYKGLTDSSLATNPQRGSLPSPDRESHAATFFSSSSKSSIVLRMQEWGSSCFVSPKDKEDRSSPESSSGRSTRTSRNSRTPTTSSSSSRRKAVNMAMIREASNESLKQPSTENKEVSSSVKRTSEVPFTLLHKGKPLRERVSQPQPPPSPPPTPPHPPLKTTHLSISRLSPQPQQAQPPLTTSTPTSMQNSSKISETLASQTQPADSAVPPKESTMESDTKYIWADKYRPFALKDFLCNRSTALQLQSLVKYPVLIPCSYPRFLLLYKLET